MAKARIGGKVTYYNANSTQQISAAYLKGNVTNATMQRLVQQYTQASQQQQTTQPTVPTPPQVQNIQNQTPTAQNTIVQSNGVANLAAMNDNQMLQVINNARNVTMPNHLDDVPDATQKFVYAAGLNEKPTVMDSASFQAYLKQNNISSSEIMTRSSNPITYTANSGAQIKLSGQQTLDMFMNSRLNYIGGKHGGQVYGAGTYFDVDGGSTNTGYGGTGSASIHAVIKPNARVINRDDISREWNKFTRTHPQTASAVRNSSMDEYSVKALLMGYQVIRSSGSYRNVIDRSAVVVENKYY